MLSYRVDLLDDQDNAELTFEFEAEGMAHAVEQFLNAEPDVERSNYCIVIQVTKLREKV